MVNRGGTIGSMMPKDGLHTLQNEATAQLKEVATKVNIAKRRRLPRGLQGRHYRREVKHTMNKAIAEMAQIENKSLSQHQIDQIVNALTNNFKTVVEDIFSKTVSKLTSKVPLTGMAAIKKYIGAFFMLELIKDLLFGGIGEVVGVAKLISVLTEDIKVIDNKDRYRQVLYDCVSPFDLPNPEDNWVDNHYVHEQDGDDDDEDVEEGDLETLVTLNNHEISVDKITSLINAIIAKIKEGIKGNWNEIQKSKLIQTLEKEGFFKGKKTLAEIIKEEDQIRIYKENGCEKVLNEATEICERISIEVEFDHQKRRAARTTVTNAEEFETKVFLPIIESATDSVTDRFKALKQHSELFSFLYDFENYEANRNNGSLQKSCKKLEIALTHDGKSDIDGGDLFVELSLVSSLVNQDNIIHAIDILNSEAKNGKLSSKCCYCASHSADDPSFCFNGRAIVFKAKVN
ncbi:uncharacterized protein LOC129567225 [Sitodiplosis mosellana]|uniref:uncharacterized protein LOC129567225 n=1 Tax=Sitodiplosis mosellana TaxID=263140 RepID=UPI0024438FAF|nr:uncharacterized protein LOC129567225 [Sitodiplosis mosellana]